ncbi:unnamed protein product [[Candida] boidinii]|nr:unnamed protein product [[Candida] boidinii]
MVADNAGLLLKNGKTNNEENCENNTTKRVVKFQFNSDGILRYLIDECNMNYLNKYLEKPKDIHPTGSILLNKQTNSSESETTSSKSSNTNYPFNTSCVEIFSTPDKFLHYCDNQFSLRKMSDSYIDEYVSHEEDDEYGEDYEEEDDSEDEDDSEEEEEEEEEEDFDMEDADDYTTPNAHEKHSCRDNLKITKDSHSISEFESDIEMTSDANEDENDKSEKKSSKKKTVRFDPIIEVFVSYSKNSTLDEIEDDLLAVEYKGVDEFQKD